MLSGVSYHQPNVEETTHSWLFVRNAWLFRLFLNLTENRTAGGWRSSRKKHKVMLKLGFDVLSVTRGRNCSVHFSLVGNRVNSFWELWLSLSLSLSLSLAVCPSVYNVSLGASHEFFPFMSVLPSLRASKKFSAEQSVKNTCFLFLSAFQCADCRIIQSLWVDCQVCGIYVQTVATAFTVPRLIQFTFQITTNFPVTLSRVVFCSISSRMQ